MTKENKKLLEQVLKIKGYYSYRLAVNGLGEELLVNIKTMQDEAKGAKAIKKRLEELLQEK